MCYFQNCSAKAMVEALSHYKKYQDEHGKGYCPTTDGMIEELARALNRRMSYAKGVDYSTRAETVRYVSKYLGIDPKSMGYIQSQFVDLSREMFKSLGINSLS